MKREARSEQRTAATGRADEAGLGDIGRHWRASRMIAAREPAPAPAPRATAAPNKRG